MVVASSPSIDLFLEMYFGGPVNMGHNMHVKLFQVLSLKIANRVTLFIKNLGPRTNQLVRSVALNDQL